ncbi:V-type ATP synthase subunit E [Acetobacterium sp.]|uniref:V-type ATP synthase subunit E n=1 Tax=Acetobacterium sp. TaxID=1872094 RepID=UPI002F404B20
MISVEEKLQVFTQYLLKNVRKLGKDTIKEAKEKKQEMLEASRLKIIKEKRAAEERSEHTIFRDKNKIIAEGKNKAKTLELEEKNQILLDFNQLIFEKAKSCTTKEVYNTYLSGCVDEIPNVFKEKKDLIVFAQERDLPNIKQLFKEKLSDYKIEYRSETKDSIGGLIVEDADIRIHCDFTIDNLLKTNYKRIGMILNGFMEKQVS